VRLELLDINDAIVFAAVGGGALLAFLCFRAYSASNEAEKRLEEIDSKLGRVREMVKQIDEVKQEVRQTTGRKVDHVALERVFSEAIDYFVVALARRRGS